MQTDPGGADPSIPPDGAAPRAAEVLDALVREQDAGSDRRSGPGARVGVARLGFTWRQPERWPRGVHPAGVLAVLLAVAVVVAVVFWRRPAPIEDRLPIASTGSGSAAPSGAPEDAVEAGSDGTGQDRTGGASSTSVADEPAELVVHVAGAVTAPGVVRLGAGSRVTDAVAAAGGLRADADPDRVNLAAPLTDGQRVVVPVVGQPAPAEIVASGGATDASGGAGGSGGDGSTAALVDLNTATESQLDELPGIGPATAAAIVAHRAREGPFRSVDALLDVRGIGEAKLDALEGLVTVGGAP